MAATTESAALLTDAPPSSSGPRPAGKSPSTRNALLLSSSFCLIFVAFSSAQNFATSRKGDTGATAVGILYVAFMLTNLVSAAVVDAVGPRLSLVAGAATYVVFVAANVPFTPATMYPAGALVGVGAAVLWTAQGVYLTRCAERHEAALGLEAGSTMGHFNGIFWSIFQVSQFAGNLLVALLFAASVSTRSVFVVTACVCAVGTASLLLLKPLPPADEEAAAAVPLSDRLLSMVRMFGEPAVQLLTPVMLFSGLSQGYIFGQFPPLIENRTWKFMTMAFFGAVDAAASAVAGRASDRYGRYAVLTVGFASFSAAFLALLVFTIPQGARGWYFAVAALLGVADGCYNTQVNALLGAFFAARSQAAFACYKGLQSSATAATFFYAKHLGDEAKTLIAIALLVAGHIGVIACHTRLRSVNFGTKIDSLRGADPGDA